jgi:hypothetical protein
MITKIRTFFLNVLSWIVIPALVVYGYYYGNEASVSITLFYMWVMFAVTSFASLFLGLAMLFSDGDMILNEDAMKNPKKLKALLKWNKKLKGKWFSFTRFTGTVLYTGLSVVIAASGAIWTAFMFILTFVVMKYIIFGIIKALYEDVIPKVEKAVEDLRVGEMLDLVGKGESK